MSSGLKNLSPITVCDKRLPTPQLFNNIPLLHRILEEVLEDWLRAVEPYQRQVDDAYDESTQTFAMISGFADLQPLLLKCLFSYAFFFVAVDKAYKYFYKELDHAKKVSGSRPRHRKRPKETPFIKKIYRIRNIAIAHFPSDRARPIDAFAAMSWQPMGLSSRIGARPDLEKLTILPMGFRGTDASGQRVESQDFEVSGVKTAHYDHCLPYLNHFDEVVCEYLQALQDEMNQS